MPGLPTVVTGDGHIVVTKALQYLRAHENHAVHASPVVRDIDHAGLLGGRFLTIEAKSILVAAMVSNVWDKLLEDSEGCEIPDPAKLSVTYEITNWKYWPRESRIDGRGGTVADLQANVLANIAFMQLIFEKQPALFGRRGTSSRRSYTAFSASNPPSEAVSESVAMADSEDNREVMLAGEDTDKNTETESAIASVTSAMAVVDPFNERSIPHANNVDTSFRLVRDWSCWPSLGVRPNDFLINSVQSQYGLAADALFESLKVAGMHTKRSTKEGHNAFLSDEAQAIIQHEDTMAVLDTLLEEFMLDGGSLVYLQNVRAKALTVGKSFRRWLEGKELSSFEGPQGESMTAHQLISAIDDETLIDVYISMGKKRRANTRPRREQASRRTSVASSDEPSAVTQAADATLVSSMGPPPARPASTRGHRGPTRNRTGNRGRSRGRGSSTESVAGDTISRNSSSRPRGSTSRGGRGGKRQASALETDSGEEDNDQDEGQGSADVREGGRADDDLEHTEDSNMPGHKKRRTE